MRAPRLRARVQTRSLHDPYVFRFMCAPRRHTRTILAVAAPPVSCGKATVESCSDTCFQWQLLIRHSKPWRRPAVTPGPWLLGDGAS
jgi:hypothetical protein